MIFIDDVLLFPAKSFLFVIREIHKAALQEMADEADSVRQELSRLYLQLEAGSLTEEQFDSREQILLDRLDALEESVASFEVGDEDDDSEDEDAEEDDEIDEDEDVDDDPET